MLEKIFCLVGASASGKDMLVKQMQEILDIPKAISYTTRPPRKGEIDGIHYHFQSAEDMLHGFLNDRFAEYYETKGKEVDEQGEVFENTWYYGFTKAELEKAPYVFAIITPDGLEQIQKIYGNKVVSIFVSAKEDIRLERAMSRTKGDEAEILRRFEADKKDFEKFTADYIVYNNGDITEAIKGLRRIIMMETSIKTN